MRRIVTCIFFSLAFIAFSANADFDAGLAAAKINDYAMALKEWKPLADHGDSNAQNKLGWMYATGKGVPQDDKEAVKWYRLAADQGDAAAQSNLGAMYAFGKGVQQDYGEAFKWFNLAADQGYAHAQFALGKMYSLGKGVTENYQEAVKWYRLAADQGDFHAQSNLGGMYFLGKGVPTDAKEGAKWLRLAADQGDVYSQRQLGLMYAIGKGVPQDDKEAAKWLRVAADQGDAIAQSKLPLLPMYKAVSDAVDRGYESKPLPDATSAISAATMMKATLHDADYMRNQCIKLDPGLESEIDLNLAQWKTTEAHAINKAETQWSSLVQKQPDMTKMLNVGDGFLQMGVDKMARSSYEKAPQLLCRKYFSDLASGIWRKRTPEIYTFLDNMP
jgi:TPR repeat protein